MHPLPSPWVGLVVALAAYRLTRLGGWDDWPPIYRLRALIIGESWVPAATDGEGELAQDGVEKVSGTGRIDAQELGLAGKQPSTEVGFVRPAYSRPLLAHLVHCPFCLGWWISLATYLWWLLTPSWGLYVLAPFAVSGFVGLVAKNLDP